MCNEYKKMRLHVDVSKQSLCNRPVRRKKSLLTKFIFSQSLYTSMYHQRAYDDEESTRVYTSNVRPFQNFVECKCLQFCNIIPTFIWWLDVWVLYKILKAYKMTCTFFPPLNKCFNNEFISYFAWIFPEVFMFQNF